MVVPRGVGLGAKGRAADHASARRQGRRRRHADPHCDEQTRPFESERFGGTHHQTWPVGGRSWERGRGLGAPCVRRAHAAPDHRLIAGNWYRRFGEENGRPTDAARRFPVHAMSCQTMTKVLAPFRRGVRLAKWREVRGALSRGDAASSHKGAAMACSGTLIGCRTFLTAGTYSVFIERIAGAGDYQVTAPIFGGPPPVCGNVGSTSTSSATTAHWWTATAARRPVSSSRDAVAVEPSASATVPVSA